MFLKNCIVCCKGFSAVNSNYKCCSSECAKKYKLLIAREKDRLNRIKNIVYDTCKECEKPFIKKSQEHLYCSSKCQRKKHLLTPDKRICKHCGNEFKPNNWIQEFCNIKCRIIYYKENNIEKIKEADKIKRKNRTEEQKQRDREKSKIYQKTPKGRINSKRSYANRRARKKNAKVIEQIDYSFIDERDKHTCQLCRKLIDFDLKFPHPMSKTYDHVIPLNCEASEHSNRNLQLAHLICNQRKRDDISNGIQPRLL